MEGTTQCCSLSVPNVPCGVESQALDWVEGVPVLVPNVPCGVESGGGGRDF